MYAPLWTGDIHRLEEFVTEVIAPLYARATYMNTEVSWCPEWFRHKPAVWRLGALMDSYDQAVTSKDRAAASVWLRDHGDMHMRELFHFNGPFKFCSVANGHKDMLPPLPTVAVSSMLRPVQSTPAVA